MSHTTAKKSPDSEEKNPEIVKDVPYIVTQLLKSLDDASRGEEVCYYRGQSNAEWKLRPSLFVNNTQQREKHIVRELISRQANDFSTDSSILDYLVRAQHFGLPTRLLDVTRMPLIALYFACYDETQVEQDGKIFILKVKEEELKSFESDSVILRANLARLSNEEKNNLTSKADTKSLLKAVRKDNPAFDKEIKVEDLKGPICFLPKQNNERILAQQGLFLLFGSEAKPLDESSEKFTIESLIIPTADKGDILKQLKFLGIHKSTVFPGIEHCAAYLKENLKDQEEEIKNLVKAASGGDIEAQLMLGSRYLSGFYVEQSYTEAEKWWEKAGKQGSSQAYFNLGKMYYLYLQDTQETLEKAEKFLREAERLGHQEAGALLKKLESEKKDSSEK